MKIVHKLILSSAAALLLTAAAVGAFFFVDAGIKAAHQGQHLANSIHNSVAELNILTYEYLLYREKRMESQWYLKHNMIGEILRKGLQSAGTGAGTLQFMENIRSSHEDLGKLFSKVVEIHSPNDQARILSHTQAVAAQPKEQLEEKLIGRMLIASQEMISNASRFNALTLENMDEAEKEQVRVITIVMALFALSLILILFLLGRSIIKPLHLLIEGTRIIGKGDLDHTVAVKSKDEIGSLAHSFNEMTRNLRETTTSRDELNIEIQERIKAEKEARQSKEEWEKTFNSMADIITIQDKNMRILRANKAAHDVFQVEPGALNGKYCYEVFREADAPCPNCPQISTLKGKESHSANITHKNLGKIFMVSSSPVFNDKNEISHLVHIAKDITEQKKMEDELFQAHKMEAIGTLAGGIAHDFNNILAAILGYAELSKDNVPEGNLAQGYLDQVLKAGKRARELVKQILTFSRKGPETQQALQPAPIIKEGLKLMRASLPATIEIKENIDSNCPQILGNPTNIHQILVNLCTNALHAMENQKGILTVSLSGVELKEADVMAEGGARPGAFIELKVSDTGCGMDEATVERIFEPYFTTKEVGEGSGMGLALVHGIVQGCNGFVKVESKPGRGSAFRVYFPVIEKKVPEIEREKQKVLPKGNERILVVDDEESIADMYQATLKKLDYQVTAQYSSKKALEAFQATPENFDLVITDQTMPNLDGSELAKKILQIRPDIPIILCTGYSSLISEDKAKEIGINRFLIKPVNREDLAIVVRELLDAKKKS